MTIAVTRAAEGLPRRAFTIADVERMVEAGLIGPDERFELIGGEIVPMSPKGIRHERLKGWLNRRLFEALPDYLDFLPETTFRLAPDTFLEPDFIVYDKATGLEGLDGASARLVIEIGASSLAFDRGRKAEIYASFGVRELWVIDAETLSTRVFREPAPDGYRDIADHPRGTVLRPILVEGLTLDLADFG